MIAEIQPFRGLLLGLFFMSMGMSLNLGALLAQPAASLGLLVALIGLKFAVLWPLVGTWGLGTRTGAAVALLLAQSGEFALVLFAYTHEANLIGTELFQQQLLLVVLSMLVTPLTAHLAQRLVAARPRLPEGSAEASAKAPIVVIGFGHVGRRIGRILTLAGKPFVAIDYDSSLVLRERASGHRIFYGDARRPDLLRAVGAADANLVIVALDDFEATEVIVAALQQMNPQVAILARGNTAEQCRRLRELGAGFVVSENLEASLELAREALIRDEGDVAAAETLLRRFRQDYYATFPGERTEPPVP